MLFVAIALPLFILQSALILTANFNIYPEMFFIPWLISKGLIPYGDFFNHHGFLLYYLLTPLVADGSLRGIQLIYFVIQSVNLFLVLIILKKKTSTFLTVFAGFLYIIVNFYVSENNVWDEVFITTFFLVVYYLIYQKTSKLSCWIIGILISACSMIKPTAALLLIPVIIARPKASIIVSFMFGWVLAFLFFMVNNGLPQLIDNLFLYNRFFSAYFLSKPPFLTDFPFLKSFPIMIISGLLTLIFNKKQLTKTPIIGFLIVSFMFILPNYAKLHLPVFTAFMILFIAETIYNAKGVPKLLFIILSCWYFVFMLQTTRVQYGDLKKRVPYIQNRNQASFVSFMKQKNLADKSIYVLGNKVELYYWLNKVPPTYFPLVFPWFYGYYDIENRIIQDLKLKKPSIVILTENTKKENSLNKIKIYVNQYYDYFESFDNSLIILKRKITQQ